MVRLDELACDSQFNFENRDSEKIGTHQMEELVVPKAIVLYSYSAKGISINRDEVLALLDRSNKDWWRVLKHDGTEGYVPANYCDPVLDETVCRLISSIDCSCFIVVLLIFRLP